MTFDLTLVLGGTASGKSAWAENYVLSFSKKPIYIATAQAHDDEMKQKILMHQKSRSSHWRTYEEPFALVERLTKFDDPEIILVDCITMWLSNLLLKNYEVTFACNKLCDTLPKMDCRVVIVSNEVGHSVIPMTKLGRRFQSDQGNLNQKLASMANRVVLITAGLPMLFKGCLQEGRA